MLNNSIYLYWVEEDSKKINGRFFRQELFALNNQFETMLDENNKFTLDFSGHDFEQEMEFLSKNKYYITSLNCKLKLKEYIREDEKIKKLSAKSRLLFEKGAA